jgi:branched-chain amino acid transport system substrate-binding protein
MDYFGNYKIKKFNKYLNNHYRKENKRMNILTAKNISNAFKSSLLASCLILGFTSAGFSNEVKFGFMIGYTGDMGAWAPALDDAAKVAVEEINKDGGVLGNKVSLSIADNQSNVEGAIKGAKKLVEVDGVSLIIGPESDPIMALLQYAKDTQVPVITSSAGTQALDEAGGTGTFIYRANAADSFLGVAYAKVILETLGNKEVVVLAENTEGTMSAAETFTKNFIRFGGKITKQVTVSPGQNVYYNELKDINKVSPEIVFMAVSQVTGVNIAKQAYQQGYTWQWAVTTDLQTDDFVNAAGKDVTKGIIALVPGQIEEEDTWQRFSKLFEDKIGEKPQAGWYQAETYDAFIIAALAMEASGVTTGSGVDANLVNVAAPGGTVVKSFAEGVAALKRGEAIDYEGASGNLNFNKFGNVAVPAVRLLKVDENGAWSVMQIINSRAFPPS